MSKQLSGQRPPAKQAQRRERRQETRRRDQAQLEAKHKRNVIIIIVAACFLIVGAVVGVMALRSALSPSSDTTTSLNQFAPPVDNIECNGAEQLAFHIHAHLSMYIDGQSVQLPGNIGITSTCYYWLHTHDASGIIHMEAPKLIKLTLGTFLKIWREQFFQLPYPTQLSSTTGWTAYINGKPYKGDFNLIELKAHELITLVYNSPNAKPDIVYSWPQGL